MTTTEAKIIGWKNGRYLYCLDHGRDQVIISEDLRDDDPQYYEGRQCDWCSKQIAR